MNRLIFGLLLSSAACGKPNAAPAPSPVASEAPAVAAPAAAGLVRVEDSIRDGKYSILLPAGFKKHVTDKPQDARWSAATDPDDVEYFVDVIVAPMPGSLEDALEIANIFPKDSVVGRQEKLPGGGYVMVIHDKDGSGTGADSWIPHPLDAKMALGCSATSFDKGSDPARRAEVEQICRSLTAL